MEKANKKRDYTMKSTKKENAQKTEKATQTKYIIKKTNTINNTKK